MTPFMPSDASSLLSSGAPPTYDLYATVNHYGAVYMGHYIAQVKSDYSAKNTGTFGKSFMKWSLTLASWWNLPPSLIIFSDVFYFSDWVLYDDENVRNIREEEIVDSTAYLLFYRHRTKGL